MSIPQINAQQVKINRDKTFDKIPLVSTGSNLIDLFKKFHYSLSHPKATPGEVKFSAYIQKKSVGRCMLLMIPIIGNIIIAIKDNLHAKKAIESIHGQKDWNARGVNVGEVPPPPKELLDALNKPCPIAADDSKMFETHVILWMPPTLNDKPITVRTLYEVATSDAFGKNKIGINYPKSMDTSPAINEQQEKGYWLALYKRPLEFGWPEKSPEQLIKDKFPDYEVPKTREVIAASVMQYGCSGYKKERILALESELFYSCCEAKENNPWPIVGAFSSEGKMNVAYDVEHLNRAGVCPVRRFTFEE